MRITANMVTIARIVLMPIPGYLLYQGADALFAALLVIIVLGLTDFLDGIMARREGTSVMGGLLDPIADKIYIAVIYLPLTERGIIPYWMTACIFARDFIVTTLRTTLSLKNAPMRTSTLAKYKTAMQMVGAGYVILYAAFENEPNSPWVWFFIIAPAVLPFALIVYRYARKTKQGPRSNTLLSLMVVALAVRAIFGPHWATLFCLYVVTLMTVVSGFSYLVDAWSAIKKARGRNKDLLRFVLEGVLVPVPLVLLLGRYELKFMSLALILLVTIEFAVGGLQNLLANQGIAPRFRWTVLKALSLFALTTIALLNSIWDFDTGLPLGEALIIASLVISLVSAITAFWSHRSTYLNAL